MGDPIWATLEVGPVLTLEVGPVLQSVPALYDCSFHPDEWRRTGAWG